MLKQEEEIEEIINLVKLKDLDSLTVLSIDNSSIGPWIRNTMTMDKNMSRDTALMDIYRVMRPGEPPTKDSAETLFNKFVF